MGKVPPPHIEKGKIAKQLGQLPNFAPHEGLLHEGRDPEQSPDPWDGGWKAKVAFAAWVISQFADDLHGPR